ncbi:hypothetical protein HYZ41_00980 [archaeon]|nr:hypothetical protein [archaeon]
MSSRGVRNVIFTVVILVIGVELLWYVAKKYVSEAPASSGTEILSSMDSFLNLFVIGLVLIILLLIPIYLSQRSEENKILRDVRQ